MKMYLELFGTSEQIDDIRKVTRADKKIDVVVIECSKVGLRYFYHLKLTGKKKHVNRLLATIVDMDESLSNF